MAIIIDMPRALSRDTGGVRLTNTRTGITIETLVTDERPLNLPEFVAATTQGNAGFDGFQRGNALCAILGGGPSLNEWATNVGADTVLDALETACNQRFQGDEEPNNSVTDRMGFNPVTVFRNAR